MAAEESHKFFPSGAWRGVYRYPDQHDGTQHDMRFHLRFRAGKITGAGTDDVGPFTWRGTYDVTSFVVVLTKRYATHQVFYEGMADAPGIFGRWNLLSQEQRGELSQRLGPDWAEQLRDNLVNANGGFHLWPDRGDSDGAARQRKKTKIRKVKTVGA